MNRCIRLLPLLAVLVPFQPAFAQTRFVIDQHRSLAWWQLDPNFGHLWATTCPDDPSWQPGEGHSGHYAINFRTRPKIKLTNSSAAKFPLFPRDSVAPNCKVAVSGSFSTSDVKQFANMTGSVTVQMDSIVNGSDARDAFAKKYVYSSARYPTVKFTVDSLTSVTVSGGTVNATAVGTLEIRGVQKPTRVQVQGVTEESGLRVRGLFAMPARELTERYGVSKVALTMGVGSKLWDTLFMGFDLILVQQ